MRKLKFHEKKLLKKVNLERRRAEGKPSDASLSRYRYSRLCRTVQKLVSVLKQMDARDPYRIEMTENLLEKLRRLGTVLVQLKFAEHLKEAVEQGHIRVGPDTITDPAFLVTRNMEDFITRVDTSKIRRKVLKYNNKLDDYDAMNLFIS